MDIDSMVDTATAEVAKGQEAAPEVAEQETPEVDNEVTQDTAEAQDEPKKPEVKPDEELTPEQLEKRERNRISHQNSKEAKMRRELREAREQLAQLQKQTQQPKQIEKPSIDDFDDLDSYYDARDAWKEAQKQNQQAEVKDTSNSTQAEFDTRKVEQEAAFAQAVPEYAELQAENAAFFDELGQNPEILSTVLQADNPELALYALMKEGSVYNLFDLPPVKLALELGKAEVRAQTYLKPKANITKAPAPMSAAKGTSTSYQKEKADWTPAKLRDWVYQ